ncbi:MAG TPA: hypothetical protein VML75_10550, partial [Kofleriaceae bacterium]|nr:hypothetical protein [Kofleriaceae bacterium]
DAPMCAMAAVLGLSSSGASQLLANERRVRELASRAELLGQRLRARGRPLAALATEKECG